MIENVLSPVTSIDFTRESEATKKLYGLDQKETRPFGEQLLAARRFVERGVRFIQLYSGAGSKWDAHSKMEENHSGLCRATDKPIAGLLKDLKARGLLDETLVVWGGEFGRTPQVNPRGGRNHHARAWSTVRQRKLKPAEWRGIFGKRPC